MKGKFSLIKTDNENPLTDQYEENSHVIHVAKYRCQGVVECKILIQIIQLEAVFEIRGWYHQLEKLCLHHIAKYLLLEFGV